MNTLNAQGREPQGEERLMKSPDSTSPSCSPSRISRRAITRSVFQRSLVLFVCAGLLLAAETSFAQAKRLVIVKVDGLSQAMVDRYVGERDRRTGKSLLPWFEHIFYERGTRVANFYVRGVSMSGPSWSLLDTGQH